MNEIKKYCYKYDPPATLQVILNGVAHYQAIIGENDSHITFTIPAKDMIGASFYYEMRAKNLLRWLD